MLPDIIVATGVLDIGLVVAVPFGLVIDMRHIVDKRSHIFLAATARPWRTVVIHPGTSHGLHSSGALGGFCRQIIQGSCIKRLGRQHATGEHIHIISQAVRPVL